jgi:hypothetical protein
MSAVTIDLDSIEHETDNAVLVIFEGTEVWLPLSQVDAIVRGKSPSVTIPEWLAVKRGML